MSKSNRQRIDSQQDNCLWRFGDVEFDEAQWQLRVRGVVVDVEPRPLDLLQILLRHAGEVVEKNELIEAVYGHAHVGDGALTNAVGRLRRVLGDDEQKMVVTVFRIGYRFGVPVQRIETSSQGPAMPAPLSFQPGDPVPRRENWRLVRALGCRPDSEVWLAEHAKTRDQRVYKFSQSGRGLSSLKREVMLTRVLREGLGEREDFVRLLDWSFEEVPFFIESEYAGLSLNEWCDQQGGLNLLPLEQRINLLASVAEAIAAAHSVGVLHKDLKPANILVVTRSDQRIQVRVADFGSGRLLDAARLQAYNVTRYDLTQTQTILSDSGSGTTQYLAPEVMDGHSATVQADVYALGVMLFQLVIGDFRKPLSANWQQDVADPLLREDITAAADGDPSRRLSEVSELARRLRSLYQRRIERAALEAERTAAARMQKEVDFLRARRTGLQIALAVLIAGFIVTGVLAWRISRAEKRATIEAQRANTVITFLNHDLLATIGDGDVPLRDLTVRQMLESAYGQVDERFKADPVAAAQVYASLATSFDRLSEAEPAERSVDHALALFDQTEGPGSESALKLMQTLFTAKYSLGKLDEAISRIARTTEAGEKRLGPTHEAVLAAKLELVRSRSAHGEILASRDTLREMLAALAASPAPARQAVELQISTLLGVIEYEFGDAPNAELHLRNALTIATRLYGADHRRVASIRAALAAAVQRNGNAQEADQLFDQCEAAIAHWEEDDSSDLLLRVKTLRAEALLDRDQAPAAVAMLKAALANWQARPRSPAELSQLYFAWGHLAEAQLRSGDLAISDQTLAEALIAVRAQLPPQHPDRWSLELDEAEHRLLHQDYAVTRAFLGQALPVDLPAMERKRVQLLRVQGLLARATDQPDAQKLLQQAFDQSRATFGPAHWQTQRLLMEMAQR